MTGAMAGFDGPRDLRNNDPRPEFVTTDDEKTAARRIIVSRFGTDSDLLDMLGVTA